MRIKRAKKKKTPRDCQRHFIKRWHQRVDVSSTPPLEAMLQVVKRSGGGYMSFYKKQSNIRSKWSFEWKEQSYIAIYDKSKTMFVTVYPYDWESENELENTIQD